MLPPLEGPPPEDTPRRVWLAPETPEELAYAPLRLEEVGTRGRVRLWQHVRYGYAAEDLEGAGDCTLFYSSPELAERALLKLLRASGQ
jgi:hypothetical protein